MVELIETAISKLSEQDRKKFDSLSFQTAPNSTGAEQNYARFVTNSFSAGESNGLFSLLARLNHGCSSSFNAAYHWRDDAKAMCEFVDLVVERI
jgi:hypothetical protein